MASLHRYGFTEPALLDERTGRLVAGHGRREALIWIKEHGEACPTGIMVDDDGEWLFPVLRGWSSRNDTEANAYIVAANQLTMAGGWHMKSLAQLLEDVVTDDAGLIDSLGFTADGLDEVLRRIDPETLNTEDESGEWTDDPATPDVAGNAADPEPADTVSDEGATAPHVDDTPVTHTCPGCGLTFEEN